MADSRGYAQIIRDIAATVPLTPGTNLVLNKYVTDVKHGQAGEHPIEVVAKDTETGEFLRLRARWAILTFSVGVLEAGIVTFAPPLPAWKSEVINMFKMARYIKIFVKFPANVTAFWDDNHYIMYVDPHARGKFQVSHSAIAFLIFPIFAIFIIFVTTETPLQV